MAQQFVEDMYSSEWIIIIRHIVLIKHRYATFGRTQSHGLGHIYLTLNLKEECFGKVAPHVAGNSTLRYDIVYFLLK